MIATNATRRRMTLRALLLVLTAGPAPLAATVAESGPSVDRDLRAGWHAPDRDAPPLAPGGSGSLAVDSAPELDGATGPDPLSRPGALLLVAGLEPAVATVLLGVEGRLHLLRTGHVAHRLDLPPPLLR